MYQLRRLRLENVGHPDARFYSCPLDFAGTDHQNNGAASPAHTIVWARNAAGKTSIQSLLLSVLLPDKVDFLGRKDNRTLSDYVLSGAPAHVIAEWQDSNDPQGRARLITGAVYQWQDTHRPLDPDIHWDRLTRRYYLLRPQPDVLELESLPVANDGGRLTLDRYLIALREAMERDHGLDLTIAKEHDRWRNMLTSAGLDPNIFRIQRDMNRVEGGITELFRFPTPEAFVDFLVGLVVDPVLPAKVRENLQLQAKAIAGRPAHEAEHRFLSAAVVLLHAVRLAAIGLSDRTQALDHVLRVVIRARTYLEASAASWEARARELESDAEDAQQRARQEHRRCGIARKQCEALVPLVKQLTLAEATEHLERTRRALAETKLVEHAWEAVELFVEQQNLQCQQQDLARLIAVAEDRAAPLRIVRDQAAAALRDRFDGLIASVRDEQEAAQVAARRVAEDAAEAEREHTAAIRAATAAQSQCEQLTAAIRDIAMALRQATAAGVVRDDEDIRGAVTRLIFEQDAARARRHAAHNRLATVADELDQAHSEQAEAARQRQQIQESHDEVWDLLARLQQQHHTLRRDARLIELAAAGTDEGVNLDVAGDHLVQLLHQHIEAAEARLVDEQIIAAEDRHASNAIERTHFLPVPPEVEHVIAALRATGASAISGVQFLRDTVSKDKHAEYISAYPEIVGGVVVMGEVPDDDLSVLAARTNVTTTAVIHVATDGHIRQIPTRGASSPRERAVLPLRRGLLDQDAAAAAGEAIADRLAGLEVRRSEIIQQRENDRELANTLQHHLQHFDPLRRAELRAREDQMATKLDSIRQHEERLAHQLEALRQEHQSQVEIIERTTLRLEELASLVPRLHELADRAANLPKLRRDAHEAAVEQQRNHDIARDTEARLRHAHDEHVEHSRVATARQADIAHYTQVRHTIDVSDDAPHEILPAVLARTPLDVLQTRYRQADEDWYRATGDSALQTRQKTVNGRLNAIASQISERYSEYELTHARTLCGAPDAVEPSRRRAAAAAARQRRETAEAEAAKAEALAEEARNDHDTPPELDDDSEESLDGVDVELGPLNYADAASAKAALQDARADFNSARSAARGHERNRARLQLKAKDARNETNELRASIRLLDTVTATLPSPAEPTELPEDPDYTLRTVYGLTAEALQRLTAADGVRLTTALQQTLTERYDEYTSGRGELAAAARKLRNHAHSSHDAKAVDQRMIARILDDPDILQRTVDHLIDQVTLREKTVADKLEALHQDQLILVQACATLVKTVIDDLDQVARHSQLPSSLGNWSGHPFLALTLDRWRDNEDLASRLSSAVDRMVAKVAPDKALKATALPDPLEMTKQFVRAALGGHGHVVAKVLKPKPSFAIDKVSVTQIQSFSGAEKMTVSVMLYCILARMRAANRSRRLPGGVGTLLLDNPIGKSSYVPFLRMQRQFATAHGVQLIYATGVKDLTAVGQFPLILRLRNGTEERTRRQYVQLAERIGTAVPRALTHTDTHAVIAAGLHRDPPPVLRPTAASAEPTASSREKRAPATETGHTGPDES
ncbi:hypothetical protein [Saccharopolyspora sp. ASAGF58]|uniref:hypothetical protein n=1 Tax=Saccharopolyspora sp. ASAGF58 TaxID=2719023 RepID=UPI00143FEE75|nr:hypothetical protein [Saccharopolyspora sp. ASAGF58]QIZ37003.1 hypothetical protein FDZ84_23115 [Saccharopolyspora sp. ASAGF58]